MADAGRLVTAARRPWRCTSAASTYVTSSSVRLADPRRQVCAAGNAIAARFSGWLGSRIAASPAVAAWVVERS